MHRLLFAEACDRGPIGAGFNRVTSADRRTQPKKPRRVRQKRSYNAHKEDPVVVSIMRYSETCE
jgi:hypothetical protein